jgi:NTE family protein
MSFGLALSGGGLKGVAHVGVLKALHDYNMYPSFISGASAGAVVAALYACGYSPEEMELLTLMTDGSDFIDPDCIGILKALWQFVRKKENDLDGIIKGNDLEALFDRLFEGRLISEVNIPLGISAVDINNGNTIIFVSNKQGFEDTKNTRYIADINLSEAVRASIAIPVIFKPKKLSGMCLVDGGVADNLPVDVLKKMGVKNILGINLGYAGQPRPEVDNIFEIASQTIDIMAYNITSLKTTDASCIITPNVPSIALYDIDDIWQGIQSGYESIKENIFLIKRALKS